MRYRLRTLLILAAILPPLLWFGWTKYQAWRAEQEKQRMLREATLQLLLTGSQPEPTTLRPVIPKASPLP
jgi:hypothetical protein